MYANSSGINERAVYDWNRRMVGTVQDVQMDPKTHAARDLIVNLSPEVREALGAGEGPVRIPMNFVSGIRRESLTLDRGINELRQIEVLRDILSLE